VLLCGGTAKILAAVYVKTEFSCQQSTTSSRETQTAQSNRLLGLFLDLLKAVLVFLVRHRVEGALLCFTLDCCRLGRSASSPQPLRRISSLWMSSPACASPRGPAEKDQPLACSFNNFPKDANRSVALPLVAVRCVPRQRWDTGNKNRGLKY
jgi:hypothetical protein